MRKSYHMIIIIIGLTAVTLAGCFQSREIRLADSGNAECVIVVPAGTMSWEGEGRNLRGEPHAVVDTEQRRQLQRDSVRDLARSLGRMSGAEIEIVEDLPEQDRRTPIYIGAAAELVFGDVGISKAGKFGFRVVVDRRRGIGLYGESEWGTSYAIYELLHRLGCRWFMPTELGEVIPHTPLLSLPVMDEKLAPATEHRSFWQGGAAFRRRNRMHPWDHAGIKGSHALEGYLSPAQLKAHPEWRLHNAQGAPIPGNRFRWTREDVALAVADTLLARLDQNYEPSISLSPGDYVRSTEDPEERRHDPDPRVWEPAAGRWSVTDRLYMLANRVAERVGEKYPDVLFGLYAYVNYNLPPAREPIHPNVIPMLAPIDYNRHHPMTWEDHPNEFWLKDMVEGWGRKAERIAFRGYGMNLAELTAPCPFITKWGTDIPILMKNNLAFWVPETMAGWDSMMPGYYLSLRMTFDPSEKPDDILADMWTRFYGAAAEPMGRYWHTVDRAWIDAREYAGSHWGYLRMFTPEVLSQARAAIDEALRLCRTSLEYRRVQLIHESFGLFELYMKMRRDWAAGNLRSLAGDYELWRFGIRDQVRRYADPADHTYVQGRYGTLLYPDRFLRLSYEDASRMENKFARHGRPMLEWKWKHNPDAEDASLAWIAPDYDDAEWPSTHVVRETWSTIGHHNTLSDTASGRSGRMVYRSVQRLGALPEGKRAYLWIGATDGSAKLYINGRHVPYLVPETTRWHEAGTELDRFSGYCTPAIFDITEALQTGNNQFAILCERTNLNELGTGGLMGPVVIYRDK